MSRSYSIKPQKNFVFTVEGLMDLYEVSRNTVSNWVSEGLRRSDSASPYIFNGMEVARFHDARKLSTLVTLRVGQFKCFTCKGRVFPEAHSIKSDPADSRGFPVSATCPSCHRSVFKRFKKENFDLLSQCIVTNTSLASIDEGIDHHPASVGKVDELSFTANDRYIHAWLQFAGRHDKKTINAHLASIRDFENFCSGKRFNQITVSDVTGYRDYLKSKVAERCLGVSTVKHRASHVKGLINWLISQKQSWNLDKTLSSYLDLPKMFDASTLDQDDKPVPTIDEAVQMIQAMPTDTRKNRRDQAMLSTAFLGALRADTVTTLLIGHVKMDTKQLVQDGRSSRTKNGKSLRIWFFPIPSIFSQILGAWENEMLALGFNDQDALFPDNQVLSCPFRPHNTEAVPAMRSANAISKAFMVASNLIDKDFSPHSAKHCIGQLSWSICRTAEERKAWSTNMGHDDEDVTQKYYSKISNERMSQIFDGFDAERAEDITDTDTELMLLYHEHELSKGTPEFERAKILIEARKLRMQQSDTDNVIE